MIIDHGPDAETRVRRALRQKIQAEREEKQEILFQGIMECFARTTQTNEQRQRLFEAEAKLEELTPKIEEDAGRQEDTVVEKTVTLEDSFVTTEAPLDMGVNCASCVKPSDAVQKATPSDAGVSALVRTLQENFLDGSDQDVIEILERYDSQQEHRSYISSCGALTRTPRESASDGHSDSQAAAPAAGQELSTGVERCDRTADSGDSIHSRQNEQNGDSTTLGTGRRAQQRGVSDDRELTPQTQQCIQAPLSAGQSKSPLPSVDDLLATVLPAGGQTSHALPVVSSGMVEAVAAGKDHTLSGTSASSSSSPLDRSARPSEADSSSIPAINSGTTEGAASTSTDAADVETSASTVAATSQENHRAPSTDGQSRLTEQWQVQRGSTANPSSKKRQGSADLDISAKRSRLGC